MADDPTIACTLGAADLAAQGAAWRRLREASEIAVELVADGVRLRFRADTGVAEELRRLTAVENECCSWATWSVHARVHEVVLEVRSTGDGVQAAQALFARGRNVLTAE
jgi:hypothetical protein